MPRPLDDIEVQVHINAYVDTGYMLVTKPSEHRPQYLIFAVRDLTNDEIAVAIAEYEQQIAEGKKTVDERLST